LDRNGSYEEGYTAGGLVRHGMMEMVAVMRLPRHEYSCSEILAKRRDY
jgi:hypothetical protein